MNYKMIARFMSRILLIEAAFMLPALIISAVDGVGDAVFGFVCGILITLAVSAVMGLVSRNAQLKFYAREGLICVGLSWIVLSIMGCLPFVISGEIPFFVDALFETVSGFTTTGASILPEVEKLSRGILYWRSFTHWVGGMGVLVFLLAFSPGGEKGIGFTMHLLRA